MYNLGLESLITVDDVTTADLGDIVIEMMETIAHAENGIATLIKQSEQYANLTSLADTLKKDGITPTFESMFLNELLAYAPALAEGDVDKAAEQLLAIRPDMESFNDMSNKADADKDDSKVKGGLKKLWAWIQGIVSKIVAWFKGLAKNAENLTKQVIQLTAEVQKSSVTDEDIAGKTISGWKPADLDSHASHVASAQGKMEAMKKGLASGTVSPATYKSFNGVRVLAATDPKKKATMKELGWTKTGVISAARKVGPGFSAISDAGKWADMKPKEATIEIDGASQSAQKIVSAAAASSTFVMKLQLNIATQVIAMLKACK